MNAAGETVLTGSVDSNKAWVWGNVYGPSNGERAEGKFYPAPRPAALIDGSGMFQTAKEPTFEEYDVSRVVNVKNVCGLPVKGDGVTDEYVELIRNCMLSNANTGKALPIYRLLSTEQLEKRSYSSHTGRTLLATQYTSRLEASESSINPSPSISDSC